jgi:hypothetical protein
MFLHQALYCIPRFEGCSYFDIFKENCYFSCFFPTTCESGSFSFPASVVAFVGLDVTGYLILDKAVPHKEPNTARSFVT